MTPPTPKFKVGDAVYDRNHTMSVIIAVDYSEPLKEFWYTTSAEPAVQHLGSNQDDLHPVYPPHKPVQVTAPDVLNALSVAGFSGLADWVPAPVLERFVKALNRGLSAKQQA